MRRGRLGVRATLLLRLLAVLVLIGIPLGGRGFDRGGSRDDLDGQVSSVDRVGFTVFRVTTMVAHST